MRRWWHSFLDMLPDLLKPWPTPALPHMRLGPPERDNPVMLQCFTWESKHADLSWWKHLELEMPTLAELGITQLWLPPPNKAMRPEGQGYDAYDLWDIGEFNQKGTVSTRWGSKEELLRAAAAAKTNGVDILIDAILNHKIGADRYETFKAVAVDPENRLRDIGPVKDIEGWTAFDFPGRDGKYSSFKWTHEHFTGIDWDQKEKVKGVFRINEAGRKGWSKWVDKELGNYDYLLGTDIDHRHPDVRKDLFAWGKWILETTGATGFRLDAIKHMDRRFLREFLRRARQLPGEEKLFAVAEYWSHSLKLILPYVRAMDGLTSFFDVPLHYNFHNASKLGQDYDLRHILHDSLVNIRPLDAVTFVDNHEWQIGQSLESWVSANFKLQAYAIILLLGSGHPCVFYGDLYPNHECYDAEIADKLKILLHARKQYAYGTAVHHFSSRNCIGFVRKGDKHHRGCVVILSNGPKDTEAPSIHIKVGKDAADTYRGLLHDVSSPIQVDAHGMATFSCPAQSVEVWVAVDETSAL